MTNVAPQNRLRNERHLPESDLASGAAGGQVTLGSAVTKVAPEERLGNERHLPESDVAGIAPSGQATPGLGASRWVAVGNIQRQLFQSGVVPWVSTGFVSVCELEGEEEAESPQIVQLPVEDFPRSRVSLKNSSRG